MQSLTFLDVVVSRKNGRYSTSVNTGNTNSGDCLNIRKFSKSEVYSLLFLSASHSNYQIFTCIYKLNASTFLVVCCFNRLVSEVLTCLNNLNRKKDRQLYLVSPLNKWYRKFRNIKLNYISYFASLCTIITSLAKYRQAFKVIKWHFFRVFFAI